MFESTCWVHLCCCGPSHWSLSQSPEHEVTRSISTPLGWDTSPSQGYSPALNLPVPIYTPGWIESLWELNTKQCPRLGLKPGPLSPEMSALGNHIPQWYYIKANKIPHYGTLSFFLCRFLQTKWLVFNLSAHYKINFFQ